MAQTPKQPSKEPVSVPITQFPSYMFNRDGSMKLCGNRAEVEELLAQNKPGKDGNVWADSPSAFGIETAPAKSDYDKASEVRWK